MGEEWKPVTGFEGEYEVSSTGGVRSITRKVRSKGGSFRTVPGQVLKQWTVNGYLRVNLNQRGVLTQTPVHRLVAEEFVPNPENLPVVRHLNDVKTDNRVENLAWGTASDNENDKVRNGGNHESNKTHCIRGHEFAGENLRLTRKGHRKCRACERFLYSKYVRQRSGAV